MRRSNSARELRDSACAYASKRSSHSRLARRAARRARPRPRRSSSGISNGACVQPSAARVAAISSAPSGAPCASRVPALSGAPLPMTVLQQISVGRVAARACAARSRASTASTSWPSTSRDHVPAVGLEARRRVVGEPAARPRRRSRCRCRRRARSACRAPACRRASRLRGEMPSIRQPSPRNT